MQMKSYKALSKFEDRFYCAVYSDYVRNIGSRELNELISTYNEITGNHLTISNPSCGACVLRVFRTIGKYYFDQKAADQKAADQKEKNQKKK